jgi:hypothetical protein
LMNAITIDRIEPQAGVRGGQVKVYCSGLEPSLLAACRMVFGTQETRLALAMTRLLLAAVPEGAGGDTLHIVQHEQASHRVAFPTAVLLAENLHPVTNPVVDRQGNIYTTVSGTQGQRVPIAIYKVNVLGDVEPFASGITNATGLALGPEGDLYVSSRHDGVIYRINERGVVTPFAQQFGTATGLAFIRWRPPGDHSSGVSGWGRANTCPTGSECSGVPSGVWGRRASLRQLSDRLGNG